MLELIKGGIDEKVVDFGCYYIFICIDIDC